MLFESQSPIVRDKGYLHCGKGRAHSGRPTVLDASVEGQYMIAVYLSSSNTSRASILCLQMIAVPFADA